MAQNLVILSNGEKLAPGVYSAFLKLQAACKAATGHTLYVSSGFRTAQDQINIFLSRFTQQSVGNGRFNDVRWWQGRRYVRHSPLGTVAVPSTSMHEKASAVDFGGIPANGNSHVARWLRANASRYGFAPTGYGFGEAWHYDYTGDPWAGGGSPAGGGGTPINPPKPAPEAEEEEQEEEDMMKGAQYVRASDKARVYMVFNEVSGFYSEHSGADGTYNNPLANNWKTGSWPTITEAHARVLKVNLDKVRRGL